VLPVITLTELVAKKIDISHNSLPVAIPPIF
jgi:hypothetical protein